MAGSSADNFKQFLYVFCGKNKVQPAYTYEEEETGFYCEVKKKHLRPSVSIEISFTGQGPRTRVHRLWRGREQENSTGDGSSEVCEVPG